MNAQALSATVPLDLQLLADDTLARVAKYLAQGVAYYQIAAAVGLKEEKIRALEMDPRVIAKMQAETTQRLDQAETLNLGWDTIEEEAAGTVLQHLRANPDPDFALRAAAVANKAQRRSSTGANVIDSAGGPATATIKLSQVFITQLHQMNNYGREAMERTTKRVDALPLPEAEKFLRSTSVDDIVKVFNEA